MYISPAYEGSLGDVGCLVEESLVVVSSSNFCEDGSTPGFVSESDRECLIKGLIKNNSNIQAVGNG